MKTVSGSLIIFALLSICSSYNTQAENVPLSLNPYNSSTAFSAWTGKSSNMTYSATNALSSYYHDPDPMAPTGYTNCNARIKYTTNLGDITISTEYHDYSINYNGFGAAYANTVLRIGTTTNIPTGTPADLEIYGNWDGPDAKLKILRGLNVICDEYPSSSLLAPIHISVYAGEELTLKYQTGFGMDTNAAGAITLHATAIPEPASLILLGMGLFGIRRKLNRK